MLTESVQAAVDALDTEEVDRAACQLAVTYAQRIDDGEGMDKLGPALLAVLESLHMTPKARAAVVKGGGDDGSSSPLDELKRKRAARQRDAEAVDTSAS